MKTVPITWCLWMVTSTMAFCPSSVRQSSSVTLYEKNFGSENDTQERRQFISTVGSATVGLWLGGISPANALQSGAAGKSHSFLLTKSSSVYYENKKITLNIFTLLYE